MVYVVNNNKHDLNSAKEYGNIKILFKQKKINIFNIENISKEMKTKLKKFDPKNDYLLISGYSILIILASKIIYDKCGIIPVLLWNAKENKYIPRIL